MAARHGTKGKLSAHFAVTRVRVGDGPVRGNNRHLPDAEVWLVGEHRASGERKFYLANLPPGTSRRAFGHDQSALGVRAGAPAAGRNTSASITSRAAPGPDCVDTRS